MRDLLKGVIRSLLFLIIPVLAVILTLVIVGAI
jgi:hypothetical protein